MIITEKILAGLFGLLIATCIVLGLNFIPYLLWNKAIAPLFDLRHFSFWQIFFLTLAISWTSRLIFAGLKTPKS